MTLPDLLPPLPQRMSRLLWGCGLPLDSRQKAHSGLVREAEDHFGEVFICALAADAPAKFVYIQWGCRLQIKMAFSNVDRSGHCSVDRAEECQSPFLKVEGRHIGDEGKVLDLEGFAQPDIAQLSVHWVGVRVCSGFSRYGNVGVDPRDLERELQFG